MLLIMVVNIVYGNIQSFLPKRTLIYNFIESNNIDLVLLVEAKIKSDTTIKYRDWKIIQHNGNQITNHARGGSLILAKPNINLKKQNSPAINNKLNECTHISISMNNADELHIFLVYIHPFSKIEESILTKASLYKHSIIIGDFNCNKSKTRQIDNFLANSSFKKMKTNHTFILTNNNDSTPDLMLYSDSLKNIFSDITLFPDFGSDHLTFHFHINNILDNNNTNPVINGTYNLNICNIPKLNELMLDFHSLNQDIDSVQMIDQFLETLRSNVVRCCPLKKTQSFSVNTLPPYLINMIKRKRNMYREYLQNRSPEIKTQINAYTKYIKRLIAQYRNYKWYQVCEDINSLQGKAFWYKIKQLSKYKEI